MSSNVSSSIGPNLVNSQSFVSLKNRKFLILVAVSLLMVVLLGYYFFKGDVKENYESPKPEFVLCYAEWCGHSKQFLPIFKEFMEEIKTNDKLKHLDVKMLDCEKNKEECSKYRIQGYPTMLLIKGDKIGDITEYNSGRTVKEMTEWLEDNL